MIPKKTLRERMTEALDPYLEDPGLSTEAAVQAAIEAIGDPCLIKTADNLEPTFTLLARDPIAWRTVDFWIGLANNRGLHEHKLDEAGLCAKAMRDWRDRLANRPEAE